MPRKFWNIDISVVDPLEYNTKVYYLINLKEQTNQEESKQEEVSQEKTNQNPDQYAFGPVNGIFNDIKFILDFEQSFEQIRESNGIQEQFDLTISIENITQETEKNFGFFNNYICDIIDPNTQIPFYYLLPLIKINYQEKFCNYTTQKYFTVCSEALQNTVKYWEKVEFFHYIM